MDFEKEYVCRRACIALSRDHTRRVQIKPKERYRVLKSMRRKVTLENKDKIIHIDLKTFENNFIKV